MKQKIIKIIKYASKILVLFLAILCSSCGFQDSELHASKTTSNLFIGRIMPTKLEKVMLGAAKEMAEQRRTARIRQAIITLKRLEEEGKTKEGYIRMPKAYKMKKK